MRKIVHLASFWKSEVCGQTVLPDRSILIGLKLVKMPKLKHSNATFWMIFKRCEKSVYISIQCTGCRYICFLLVFLSGTNWYWANYASRFSTCAVQRLSNVSAKTHVTTWPSSLSGLIIQTTSRRPDPVSSVVVFPDNSKWSSSYFFKDRCIGH